MRTTRQAKEDMDMRPTAEELDAMQAEARSALAAWRLEPGAWRIVGYTRGMQGSALRPIVELDGARWLVRRQPPDLSEDDMRFRQAFVRHLAESGLPTPTPLPRPDGHTYAITPEGVYELQRWLPGATFTSDNAHAAVWRDAAARTLADLHQASADFAWQPHTWPEERSAPALAQAYTDLIRVAADTDAPDAGVAEGLARLADACDERIDAAADALAARPGPPELHVHGDYQPHNLGFAPLSAAAQDGASTAIPPARLVVGVYDFDAAHWGQRVVELAYSLLYFTGVRWGAGNDTAAAGRVGVTPPLVDDGLDVGAAQAFLRAYGQEAPPALGEAALLGDALTLVFPIVFANGAGEDLIFPDDYEQPDEASAQASAQADTLARLAWADRFWLWLDRYRDTLGQAWSGAI